MLEIDIVAVRDCYSAILSEEEELISIVSKQMAKEIDQDIIDTICGTYTKTQPGLGFSLVNEIEIEVCENDLDAIAPKIAGGIFRTPGVYALETDVTSYE